MSWSLAALRAHELGATVPTELGHIVSVRVDITKTRERVYITLVGSSKRDLAALAELRDYLLEVESKFGSDGARFVAMEVNTTSDPTDIILALEPKKKRLALVDGEINMKRRSRKFPVVIVGD